MIPVLVNALLTFVATPQVPLHWGLLVALGLAVCPALQTLNFQRHYWRSHRLVADVRSILLCVLCGPLPCSGPYV